MNFSGEDRKEVFFFFEEILKSYKQPVYYENIRGHVSKAPANVRKYILTKCRGDNFLEYFKRRKNYFNEENGKISLKEEFGNNQLGISHASKSKKKNSKGKFVRKSTSYLCPSYASAVKGSDSSKNGDKEYESITITYFRNRLIRKKKERLMSIFFMDLPKKVKRHLQVYHKSSVESFFCSYPDKFVIDSDTETVSLVHISELNTNSENSSVKEEPTTNFNQDSVHNLSDPDIKKASDFIECVTFFVDVLKKLNQPFAIEKLGGYFSQARKEIQDHVKMNYKSFKFFFDDAPLIFLKNTSEKVSLSKEYRKLIKAAESLIKNAKNGLSLPSEVSLKSCIDYIFQPQISTSELSESQNGITPVEDTLLTDENLIEELLKLGSSAQLEWEENESTDDYFNNYLMRSTSRESSFSSRSTRSISVENSVMEEGSGFKSNVMQSIDDIEATEIIFLRCAFTVELLCLDFIEKDISYIKTHEKKAIEYFMTILDTASTKLWKLTNLQGSIGNDREIAQFMNKVYKGDKFLTFFENHPQFKVDFPFVKLALHEETNSKKDFTFASKEINAIKSLEDLYEMSDFKSLLKETYLYLNEVCKFCWDKNVKVDRLSGILSKFPSCLNMTKSFKGQSLPEKIEYFLRETMIFKFPENGSISFPYEYFSKKCHILFSWFEEMNNYDPSEVFICFSDFLKGNANSRSTTNSNGYINLLANFQHVTDIIESEIVNRSELNYYELPKIIPECVLLPLANDDYCSRLIVSVLLGSRNFRMENGKISLHKINEENNTNNNNSSFAEINCDCEDKILEESSNDLKSQQNVCDSLSLSNNLIKSLSSSLSDISKDINTHPEESKTELEFCTNKSSERLLITNCKTSMDCIELQSKLAVVDDKITVNPSFISEDRNRNLGSVNENPSSETSKEAVLQNKNLGDTNAQIEEENLSPEVPSTDVTNFNSAEETGEPNVSKSILSSTTLYSIEENGLVSESSRGEDKITGEIIPSVHIVEESIIHSELSSSDIHEMGECPEENEILLSMCDNTNLLVSKSVKKQGDKCLDNQINVPSCNSESPPNISLEKVDLAEHNASHEVENKNAAELNIKASKMEQKMSFKSIKKDTAKFKIDSLITNHHPSEETEKAKAHMLRNCELSNKDTTLKTLEHSIHGNIKLDSCNTFEQIEKESFNNHLSQVCDINNVKLHTDKVSEATQNPKDGNESKGPNEIINKKTNVHSKHSCIDTPEELFDFSFMKQYLNSGYISDEGYHSTRSLPKHVESIKQSTSKNSFEYSSIITSSKELSKTSSCNDLSSGYPMQPIAAKVVLLTNNSCMALSDIRTHKQNIYFLKCAFTCEHLDDCLDCFHALQIGDEISCFVPLTEISQKIWIAFLVTKDNSDDLNGSGILEKLKVNDKVLCEGSRKSQVISAHVKNSVSHFGCQTNFHKHDKYYQTYLGKESDSQKTTKESSCQTGSNFVKHVSVQTENLTFPSVAQPDCSDTEIPQCRNCVKSCMHSQNNVLNENATHEREAQLTKNVCCQTYSTGQILMLKHHPM